MNFRLLRITHSGPSPAEASAGGYVPWVWRALVILLVTRHPADHHRADPRADEQCFPPEDADGRGADRADLRVQLGAQERPGVLECDRPAGAYWEVRSLWAACFCA